MTREGGGERSGNMISVAIRMALEQAVARIIQLDVVTARRLAALDGRVLRVRSTIPSVDTYVRFGEQLELLSTWEQEADCTLSGSAFSLLRLALSDAPLTYLQQSDITLEGNSELLLMAATIVREADFDWEGLLAQYTGGLVAHALGSAVRQGRVTASDITRMLAMNLPEYIQEELRVLPPPGEVDAFVEDLNQLRLASDRLQARVERLMPDRTGDENI